MSRIKKHTPIYYKLGHKNILREVLFIYNHDTIFFLCQYSVAVYSIADYSTSDYHFSFF